MVVGTVVVVDVDVTGAVDVVVAAGAAGADERAAPLGLAALLLQPAITTAATSRARPRRDISPRVRPADGHDGAVPDDDAPRYLKPGWFTTHVFNGLVAVLTRVGISVWGSRQLRVRGRKSGEWRTTPVNLLSFEGRRYLVAPRGETQWVRNLRAAGNGELRVGRRVERFRATELSDSDKPPVLRAYLKRWKVEVGVFFGGVSATSPDEDLARIAPDHPVFAIADAG